MQQELTPLLYLSEQKELEIVNVAEKLNSIFHFQFLQNEDKLLPYISNEKPTILIIDQNYLNWAINVIKKFSKNNSIENFTIILLGSVEDEKIEPFIFNYLELPVNKSKLYFTLKKAHNQLLLKHEIKLMKSRLNVQTNELQQLNNIGIALSAEHDPDKLLELILNKSKEITHADAGSLYLVEKKPNSIPNKNDFFADKQLRFKLSQCDSVQIGFTEFVMPIEKKSIAGYVALSDKILNIPDVYILDKSNDFGHNKSFDKSVGYRSKSMLVIPMKTRKNETIGVLQLINRKKDRNSIINTIEKNNQQVIPFDNKCVNLASSLASQAAVSIENNRLYEEIKLLFEGFIKASVHAIEQRDPTTSGHSERVAILTTALAKEISSIDSGKFKNINFSIDAIQQINYAALLHDFGKIGVRENILIKPKKLFQHELDLVKYRFKLLKHTNIQKYLEQKIIQFARRSDQENTTNMKNDKINIQQFDDKLDYYLNMVLEANEPKILAESGADILNEISEMSFDSNGQTEKMLTENELKRLSIPKGSLSEEERKEIESHVTHTFNFLRRIPWTSELKDIPNIAHTHHEKLDGSGYPHNLNENEIPIQAKMMAIADIFDALTASDRPYKKAAPADKALNILKWEVEDGKLDKDLYQIFIDAKIYELVLKKD